MIEYVFRLNWQRDMKITILGTRGEIEESAPYHSKKSGVLVNDILLLDIGDKNFLEYKPRI